MSTATLPKLEEIGTRVGLGQVEKELSGQFRAMQGDEETPVQRVRMSNLVVYCDSPAEGARLSHDVGEVVQVHPARVLLLVGEPHKTEETISAAVCVQCHLLGKRQQACSEQIILHGTGRGVDRLPFAVRSLLIGDLPTNLWWSSTTPPALSGALLHELAETAQQIMYDSLGWPDPAKGVAATAPWLDSVERTNAGRWRVASDLNWRRLKYWRRVVAQALDEASAPGAAESIREVVIQHGPHAVVQGYEIVGWLGQRLGWQLRSGKAAGGVETAWQFGVGKGEVTVRVKRLSEGPPEINRMDIACAVSGKPVTMTLAKEDAHRLSIKLTGADAAPRTITVPPQTAAELIGRQLSDRERDPVFRQSMTVAQQLAQSVIGR